MNFLSYKSIILSSLGMIALSGCADKDIVSGENNNGALDADTDGIEIKVPVNLSTEGSTRATTLIEGDIDDYIDLNNFQMLFLDKDGNFLFQPNLSTSDFESSPDHAGQYDVTVRLTQNITDKNNNKIPLSLIKNALEEDFRIAVLANWSHYNKETEAHETYTLDWGWNESALNSDVRTPANINDIHHLVYDNYYDARKSAYSFIMDDESKMGVHTNWVKMRDVNGKELIDGRDAWHLSTAADNSPSISEDAYTWIKNNWDPSVDDFDETVTDHRIYRQYTGLWQLWNFGGGANDTEITYDALRGDDKSDKFADKWKTRNGNMFAGEGWCQSTGTVISENKSSNDLVVDGLTVVTKSYQSGASNDDYIRSYVKENSDGKKLYGLILPQMNSGFIVSNSGTKPRIDTNKGTEYLKFTAPGTGKLRVLFSSVDENDVTLVVQRGSTWEMTYQTTGTDVKGIGAKDTDENVTNMGVVFDNPYSSEARYKVNVDKKAEEILIFAKEGTAVIYAVEFVCDEYLSGTDREGIIPNHDLPIPMYGIQEFPGIDAWGSVPVWNLRSLTGKYVALLRSLAKVELYLPAGKEYAHVYMRSMNRMARCETMDVLSSTADLWKDHYEGIEDNCEWFRIQQYGSGYEEDFKTYYSWFFGSWASWWGEKNSEYSFNSTSYSYDAPQLFNPDVERSDFCHFIMDPSYDEDNYARFILYVPDKAISDPNTAGNMSSTAKVPHIEYRYSINSQNLDDDDCYRIYFTDYSTNSAIKDILYDEFESKYEKDKDNLDLNWPIMRNHIYRFYVGGSNTPQEIRVKVNEWGKHPELQKETW